MHPSCHKAIIDEAHPAIRVAYIRYYDGRPQAGENGKAFSFSRKPPRLQVNRAPTALGDIKTLTALTLRLARAG